MFRPLTSVSTQHLRFAVLANGASVAVGDLVVPDATNTKRVVKATSTNGSKVLGVVVGIATSKENLVVDSTGKPVESITAANPNSTNVGVLYIPAHLNIEYEADVDADLGTTAGSDGVGYFALNASGSLAENSYVKYDGTGAPKLFLSYGKGSSNTKVVGRISLTL